MKYPKKTIVLSIIFSCAVKEMFKIVNSELISTNYELVLLENKHYGLQNDSTYSPHKVMKSVCGLIEEGARIMVRTKLWKLRS